MRNLEHLKQIIEERVDDYIHESNFDKEYISDTTEFEIEENGETFIAGVHIEASFTYDKEYDYSVYGCGEYVCDTRELASSSFEIEYLYSCKDGEDTDIIVDYKQVC